MARIIEFLNEQMRPAEVLAIEVEQFTGTNGMRTLVPRLVGATERAQTVKAVTAPTERLSEADWLSDLESRHGAAAARGAEQIAAWFRANGFEVKITQSQDAISAQVSRSDGKFAYPFFIRRSTGRLEMSLQYLVEVPIFRGDDARRKLLERIRSFPASTLKASAKLTSWPSVSLEELLKPELWAALTELASDVKMEIQRGLS